MANTATTPEALAELRSVLRAFATTAVGVATQTSAAAGAVVSEAEKAVRARSAKKAALEAALRAAKPKERARLQRELQLAEESLQAARRSLSNATEAARAAQALHKRINESANTRVPRASESLGRKLDALSDYRAVPSPGSAGVTSPSDSAVGDIGYGVEGIVDVPIENATFDDNPIKDGYHRGGADISDYRWAVETWDTVVRPGVLAGKTREDFERRDNEMGRYSGFRRTTGVYDMFLGDDSIHFSRRADGTLDVASGRHRVEIARQLGLTHLPGRLHG